MRRAGLVGMALLVVGVVSLKAWVGSDSMRERVRSKVVARLGEGVEVGPDFSVDWLGSVSLGPVTVAPVVKVGRIVVRPRWAALIRGALEVGSIGFDDVVIDAGEEGADLRATIKRLRRPALGGGASSPKAGSHYPDVSIERVAVRSTFRGRPLELVASTGRLVVHRDERGETHLEGSIVPGTDPSAGAIRLLAALGDDGFRAASVTIDQGVALSSVVPVKDFALMPSSGSLRGAAQVSSRAQHHLGELSWQLVFDSLSFSNPRLASEPVEPLRVSASGSLTWDFDARALTVTQLTLGFGNDDQVVFESAGSLEQAGETTMFAFQSHSVDLDYQRAVSSLPAALAPGQISADVGGPLSVTVDVKGPLREPLQWQLTVKIDLAALRQVARATPHALTKPFIYKTTLSDGRVREVVVGPSNPAFVPLGEVPRSLLRAVLLCEDSMFMTHQGFDFFEMKNDLFAENENGESVLRGASTMTQQLAKNLYLSREKTYARKIREAFLTLALEATVPKERLLEIYLNIIEWGPGVNGLGEAAKRYFNKSPGALTVKEAAYLATIIPGPIRYYGFFTKGELPEVWERRLAALLVKMHEAGDLTDEGFREAMESPLVFAKPP